MQIASRVIGTVGCSYKRYLSLYVLLIRIVSIDGAGLRPFLVYQGEVQFPFHARFPVASHGFGLRPKICRPTPIHLACVQTSPISFPPSFPSFSVCNKGNRRRLNVGNDPSRFTQETELLVPKVLTEDCEDYISLID